MEPFTGMKRNLRYPGFIVILIAAFAASPA